jgi:hypothetical protein
MPSFLSRLKESILGKPSAVKVRRKLTKAELLEIQRLRLERLRVARNRTQTSSLPPYNKGKRLARITRAERRIMEGVAS